MFTSWKQASGAGQAPAGKTLCGMREAATRDKYWNWDQQLDAHRENTMEKSHGELLLRVLDQEQHKRGEIPFSLMSSRGFWTCGRDSPL